MPESANDMNCPVAAMTAHRTTGFQILVRRQRICSKTQAGIGFLGGISRERQPTLRWIAVFTGMTDSGFDNRQELGFFSALSAVKLPFWLRPQAGLCTLRCYGGQYALVSSSAR